MILLKKNTIGTTGTMTGQIGRMIYQIGRTIGQTGRVIGWRNFSVLLTIQLNGYLRLAQVLRTLKLRGLVIAMMKTTTSKTVIASQLVLSNGTLTLR